MRRHRQIGTRGEEDHSQEAGQNANAPADEPQGKRKFNAVALATTEPPMANQAQNTAVVRTRGGMATARHVSTALSRAKAWVGFLTNQSARRDAAAPAPIVIFNNEVVASCRGATQVC